MNDEFTLGGKVNKEAAAVTQSLKSVNSISFDFHHNLIMAMK